MAQTGRSNVELDRPPPQQCNAVPRQPQRRAAGGAYGVPTTEIESGVKVFFADPRSPWQRGTNENTHGLLRQYFPMGSSLLM